MKFTFQSFSNLNFKMSSLLTIALTGKSSILLANFMPEIILDGQYDYSCALLDLYIKNGSGGKISVKDELRIDCDIISGSYINGARKQTIHQFFVSASLNNGQILRETPQNLNYFPVKTKFLQSICISIYTSDGKLLDISGSDLICRLNIKRETIKN